MAQDPEDLWLVKMKARWAFISIILAFFLGAYIIYWDIVQNPPTDLQTSGFGALLMGILPVSALDGLIPWRKK